MRKYRVRIYIDTESKYLLERNFVISEDEWDKLSDAQDKQGSWLCLPAENGSACMIPVRRIALIEAFEYTLQ